MLFLDVFDYFDPKEGEVPEYHANYFSFVAKRARTILKDRTSDDIWSAYNNLEWMYSEKGPHSLEIEALHSMENPIYPDHYDEEYSGYSAAHDILKIMHFFDLSEFEDSPISTWSEYFAVLALGKIAEAKMGQATARRYREETGGKQKLDDFRRISEYLVEATDAIRIAEFMQDNEGKSKDKERQKIASKGGKKKNAPFVALRKKILHIWAEKYSHISNRQASSKIWNDLSDEDRSVLRSDEPEKRLEIWIGQYKRGQSSSN